MKLLDELAEFDHLTLEIMRQPLEDRKVTITRAAGTVSYPCSFMLVGAMNPCPCGYYGHPKRKCTCSERQVRQYLNRISGPLLDRFDLHIEVEPVSFDSLSAKAKADPAAGADGSGTTEPAVCRNGHFLQRSDSGRHATGLLSHGRCRNGTAPCCVR